MINTVYSGGQKGADQAGWRAARRFRITTAGMMPKGFRTESPDGKGWGERHPEFAKLYGAIEHPSSFDYPPRTEWNVLHSDATLWFGIGDSPGYYCTERACKKHSKPFISTVGREPQIISTWIKSQGFTTINVAGGRESSNPELGAWTEQFLCELFHLLGHTEV